MSVFQVSVITPDHACSVLEEGDDVAFHPDDTQDFLEEFPGKAFEQFFVRVRE